ncbi:VanZ family protein [Cellulomonas cellasea]|uniref:VanZ-like domain-containing protein n=1 Tax=Cellulomonas cellasea TaxID=43670 RepID=A0A7W4UGH1_9CELL|nr:VanZ family protein [Cellulomonas cellasea]MBB2923743.1 hypothetical protein [Cellulomonas cellasea]
MQQYLHAFGGLIALLGLVAAGCGVALALLGARAVRDGATWSSYLARVGPRVAFAVFCLGTAFATLTPAGARDGRAVDLVPLRTALAAGMTTTTPTQIAGNLALLFWLGLLLPVVSSRRWTVGRTTAVVAVTSAGIEAAQYVLGLGRFSTVDDVLLNTLGGAVAAVVGVHVLAPWVRRHQDPRPWPGARTTRTRTGVRQA